MIPIVASADDIDTGVKYGNNHPNARWYIGKRLEALDAVERIPEDWPETQPIVAARMPKLGTGKRFANLKGQLARSARNGSRSSARRPAPQPRSPPTPLTRETSTRSR